MLREKELISNLNENLVEIKTIIRSTLKTNNNKVNMLIKNLPADEGKLIRGIFTLIGGSFGKIEKERLLRIAAGVELLHLATLVHDDIVDDSTIRRNKETIHSIYGVKAGLFTGDYLFSEAYILFSKSCSSKSILDVSETIKLICSGEINQFFSIYSFNSSIKDYLKRINGKCASLFSLSLSIGAHESNAEVELIHKLKKIGYYTGMAFQLIDDLLDITSSHEILGKPEGNDIKEGIYTMPVIYELKKGNKYLEGCLKEDKLTEAIHILKESEGVKKSKETAEKYTYRSLKLIDELPNTDKKQVLRGIVEKMLIRSY